MYVVLAATNTMFGKNDNTGTKEMKMKEMKMKYDNK